MWRYFNNQLSKCFSPLEKSLPIFTALQPAYACISVKRVDLSYRREIALKGGLVMANSERLELRAKLLTL